MLLKPLERAGYGEARGAVGIAELALGLGEGTNILGVAKN